MCVLELRDPVSSASHLATAAWAVFATLLSYVQRVLSTPVRRLRRQVATVEGRVTLRDGTTEPLGTDALRAAPERALRLLSLAMPLLAIAMVVAKVE